MAHSPVNPLYKKKPGETTADHMRRLRKEFPKKFGKQRGPNKNPTKKFTAEDLRVAEARAREDARKEFEAAAPAPAPAKPISETTVAAPAETPAPAGQRAPAPAVVSSPAPAAVQTPPAPQLVSEAEIFSPAPAADQTAPETAGPGQQGPPPPASVPAEKADGGKYGAMIWGIIVKLFCSIFGNGFEPIVIKDSAGQVVYDEGAEGLKVWVNYLASIGVKTFSPVVELWIFMSSYVGLRAGLIIAKFKNRKKAGASPSQPKPEGPTESPQGKPESEPSKPTKQTPPAGPPPAPPAPSSPPMPIGEFETGETEI